MGGMNAPPAEADPHSSGRPRMDPRSKLEIIYQEVLGEVGDLVGRLEKASAVLTEAAKEHRQTGKEVAQLAGAVREAVETERSNAVTAARQAGQHATALLNASRDATAAARAVERAGKRTALLALGIGVAAGLLGGILGGFFIASGVLTRMGGG